LRQEQGILPTMAKGFGGRQILLTSEPRTANWRVPGAKPKIITLGNIPASSGGGPCEEGCKQVLESVEKGQNMGSWTPSSIEEEAFEWYWKPGPFSLAAGSIEDELGTCGGPPKVPKGMTTVSHSNNTTCKEPAIETVGYLTEAKMITNVPIQDGETPADFQSNYAPKSPNMEELATALSSALELPKYHYLNTWYRFQFAEGCNPDSCEVPNCRGLALETCESLLEAAGFDDLSHETLPAEETDFYVSPDSVTATSPVAGTEVSVEEPIAISVNLSESYWNAELLKDFGPILVYDEDEAFYADSPAVITDAPEDSLSRRTRARY
jgi:hypothetical protein